MFRLVTFIFIMSLSHHAVSDQSGKSIIVAAFNVSMEARNYAKKHDKNNAPPSYSVDYLRNALKSGQHPQIQNVAEIIQRVRPDVLLLNEFDLIEPRSDGIERFVKNYLNKGHRGAAAIDYPYLYVNTVNTGVIAKHDLNGDGEIKLPQDAYGFGFYPGHYGMALLSRFPIVEQDVRTFQMFKWKDMPGALKPELDGKAYYSSAAWDDFRLSSKSHWDIPIDVNGQRIHVLASHPTPPVFDGPEDRNGRRNHDEVRFWNDYIDGAPYIYDDKGVKGGLEKNAAFIIAGDLNSSPVEGSARREAITALLSHPRVAPIAAPVSEGGRQQSPDNVHGASHTASWGMRADYAVPSAAGFEVTGSGVFWPAKDNDLYRLVKDRKSSSDHRLVWVELTLGSERMLRAK